MRSEKEENTKKMIIPNFLDSAVIIAIITGILYLISFFYLKGFYSYYGLMDIEIDFSLFRVLKVCLEILQPLLFYILSYSLLALSFTRIQKNPNLTTYFYALWIYILSLFFIKASKFESLKSMQLIYTIFGFVLTGVIIALIIIRILPERLQNKISNFFDNKKRLPLSYINKIVCFFYSVLIIMNFIPKYGFYEAKNKNNYLYDSQNQRVLIYQDNEKSVFLPKNENGNFEKKYIIVSTSDLSNILLEHYEQTIQFENKDGDGKD